MPETDVVSEETITAFTEEIKGWDAPSLLSYYGRLYAAAQAAGYGQHDREVQILRAEVLSRMSS